MNTNSRQVIWAFTRPRFIAITAGGVGLFVAIGFIFLSRFGFAKYISPILWIATVFIVVIGPAIVGLVRNLAPLLK